MSRRKIIIAKAGDPVASVEAVRGPFSRMIEQTIGDVWDGDFETFDAREGSAPDPRAADAFIITGSAANVPNRDPWMPAMEAWLVDVVAAGTPMFGICFGHQMLAHALGGLCTKNGRGREIGTIRVQRIADDPLFDGVPGSFHAQATHVDTAAALPPNAVALARSSADEHQAIRFSDTCYGVQFHPEFDAGVITGYVAARREILVAEGFDVDALLASIVDTELASRTLHNFVRHVIPRGRARR